MDGTSFDQIRHCNACNSHVHFCDDDAQLAYAVKQGWCVSLTADSAETLSRDGFLMTVGIVEEILPATFETLAAGNPAFSAPPNGYRLRSWADQSPLHLLGYRVGRKGLSLPKRRLLLATFFDIELPAEYPEEHACRWGKPGTAERRQAMALHLRWLARQAGQRDNFESMTAAMSDWEQDAAFVEGTL
ncbi:hypothetical protein [Caulobacter sp.]|uniref:hypothetical protein n=1 Tax=Caulobacter sp. TaxID=78 RepID=UPI003BA8E19B